MTMEDARRLCTGTGSPNSSAAFLYGTRKSSKANVLLLEDDDEDNGPIAESGGGFIPCTFIEKLDYADFSEDEYEEDMDAELDDIEREMLSFDQEKRRLRRLQAARNGDLDASSVTNGSIHSSFSMPNFTSPPSLSRNSSMDSSASTDTYSRGSRRRGSRSTLLADGEDIPAPTSAIRRNLSLPSLLSMDELEKRIQRAVSTNVYCQTLHGHDEGEEDGVPQVRPDDYLKQEILQGVIPSMLQSETWEGYFVAITPARLAAHSVRVSRAIRKGDVTRLRQLHRDGIKPLDSCNSAGESMMHLACRLGKLDVVKFLVEEAHVSVRVQDDAGRTPLHEACWTNAPNFELIELIVSQAPELVFVTDKRGFTALRYIPNSCWGEWAAFLRVKEQFLRLKVHHIGYKNANDQLDSAQERLQALVQRATKAMDSM